MSARKRSPLAATIALTALLGASGQAPPSTPIMSGPASVEAAAPQAPSTRTTPTPTQTTTRTAEKVGKGGGGNPAQAWNVKRQARRVLERIGAIDSGRQWKQFRRLTRTSAPHAELWQTALEVARKRIIVAGGPRA